MKPQRIDSLLEIQNFLGSAASQGICWKLDEKDWMAVLAFWQKLGAAYAQLKRLIHH
jgi:hypothetical protein